jgi:bacillopeptidase F (M6 metalloprotease family)
LGSGQNACGFPNGTGALTGSSSDVFQPFVASLAAWQGQTVQLRFTYSSDAATDLEGVYIDDIAVQGAEVAGSCFSPVLFVDGFEAGTTAAWDTVVP